MEAQEDKFYNALFLLNGQTHVKNLAAFDARFLTFVCPFCSH